MRRRSRLWVSSTVFSITTSLNRPLHRPALCEDGDTVHADGAARARFVQAPAAPVRTCFFGGMFCFARAEALVVDAPPDVHAPFLNLGDEMSMAARLWTRGWDFFAPHRNIAFHLYKNNYRNLYFNEDRRMGLRLYADEAERYGSLDDVRVPLSSILFVAYPGFA
jgi:hypothetical protein